MFWLKLLLGKRYLLNTHSGEIHDLKVYKEHSCYGTVQYMKKEHRKFLTQEQMFEVIGTKTKSGKLINGCKFCMKKYDIE